MYNARQFADSLKSGAITIDANGHAINGLTDQLVKTIDRAYRVFGEGDKANPRRIDELNDPQWLTVGMDIDIVTNVSTECRTCGKTLIPRLRDAQTICVYENVFDREPGQNFLASVANVREDMSPCEFAQGVKPASNTINLPTGKLVFCNFIGQLKDEADSVNDDYNLCFTSGRRNTARLLSEQNAGYFRAANMRVSIWQHRKQQRLAIVDLRRISGLQDDLAEARHFPDDPTVQANLRRALATKEALKGWKKLGDISCSMWRVMCADQEILNGCGHVREPGMDYVEAAVSPGTWELTDYFDSDQWEHPFMAELKLAEVTNAQ